MFPPISGIKLVLTGIPILATLVNAELSKFLGTKFNGKKVFGKEGESLNLTWEYEIRSLPPYGTKVMEFLFGEWMYPGFVSKKCFKVDENKKVVKAKGCEAKYGYKENIGRNGFYQSNVAIYNLTKSDMEKKYGIDIEMGVYRSPLEDWFELHTFVKAKITHFSISRNATAKVKEGDAVNITCRATGGPKPNVTLYKQDKSIMEGKGEVMHQIEKASIQDAGEYVCVASNDDVEAPDKRRTTLSVTKGAAQESASSKKCFSEPWILGFLLLSRWI